MSDPNAPQPSGPGPQDTVDAPSLCGAYGAGGQVTHELPPPAQRTLKFVTTTATGGQTFLFDVVSRKKAGESGNWNARAMTYVRNPDGSNGGWLATRSWTVPYNWTGDEIIHRDLKLWTGSQSTSEIMIGVETTGAWGISAADEASYTVQNVRIVKPDTYEVIDRPCDQQYVARCMVRGGSAWLAGELTIDGQTYEPGCYTGYESCLIGGTGSVPCADDFFVNDELIGQGVEYLQVGLVTVIYPTADDFDAAIEHFVGSADLSAPGARVGLGQLLGVSSLLAVVAVGFTTTVTSVGSGKLLAGGAAVGSGGVVPILIGGVVVFVAFATAYAACVHYNWFDWCQWPGFKSPPDNTSWSPTAVQDLTGGNPVTVSRNGTTGQVEVAGVAVVDQIFQNRVLDAHIDDDEYEDIHIEGFKRAIHECILTKNIGEEIWVAYGPAGGTTDYNQTFVVNGVVHALCELIPIYMPGGVTRTGRVDIADATFHVNETLYGTQHPYGANQYLGPNYNDPRPGWVYLHYQPVVRNVWYQTPATYNCQDNTPAQLSCDEWPPQAALENTRPTVLAPIAGTVEQPHLRFVSPNPNSALGGELGAWLQSCGAITLAGQNPFFVIPFTTHEVVATPSLPSEYQCGLGF